MSYFLDSFLVPTVSWPWQVMMRTLRAAHDPNIDLLSEKGLWTKDMLPLNFWGSRKNDASAKDLGIENPWGQFAVDVALDPTTYAGSALTKAGRAAQAFGEMRNGDRMRSAIQDGVSFNDHKNKVSEYMEFARQALGAPGIDKHEAKAYLRHAELEEFKDMTAAELLKMGKDRELMIGLPLLMGRGIGLRVPTSSKSWFSLAASGTRKFYTYATLTPALKHLPGIGHALEAASKQEDALRAGLTRPIIPHMFIKGGSREQRSSFVVNSVEDSHYITNAKGEQIGLYDSREKALLAAEKMNKDAPTPLKQAEDYLMRGAAGEEWSETHDGAAVLLFKKLRETPDVAKYYDAELARGTPPKNAFLKAVGLMNGSTLQHESPAGRLELFAKDALGLKELPKNGEELQNATSGFVEQFERAKQRVTAASVEPGIEAVKYSDKRMFQWGQTIRKGWNKAFKMDLTTEDLLEQELAQRGFEAGNHERVQSAARFVSLRGAEIGREEFPEVLRQGGNTRDALNETTRQILEAKILPEEVYARREAVITREGVQGLYNNMTSFLARGSGALKALRERIEDKLGNADDWQLELGGRKDGGTFFSVTDYPLTRETLQGSQELEALEKAGKSDYNLHRLIKKSAAESAEGSEGRSVWGEYLGFVSDDHLRIERDRLMHKGNLTHDEDATLGAIESLMLDRADGTAQAVKRPIKEMVNGDNQGFRTQKEQLLLDPDGVPIKDMSKLERAFVRMAGTRAEIKGWMERTKDLPPSEVQVPLAMMDDFEGAAMEWNSMVDEATEVAFGESGRKYMEAMDYLRSEVFRFHRDAGLLGSKGFPLAYLPRVASNSIRTILKTWMNEAPDEVKKHLGVGRSQLEARNLDMLTVDQLEELERSIITKDNPELGAKLREVAEKAGVKLEVYTSDPAQALLVALGNAQSEASHAKFVNKVLENGDETRLIGGKLVGTFSRVGDEIVTRYGPVPRTEALEDSLAVKVDGRVERMETPLGGLLIEDQKGRLVRVPMSMIGANRFRVAGLSRIGASPGDSLAIALATNDLVDVNAKITGEALHDLIGRNVLFGTDAHVGSMVASSRLTMTKGADMFRAVDTVNYHIKKWQTLYRVSYHVSNMISSVHQSLMIGTSLKGTTLGYGTAFRYLFGGGAEEIKNFDRLGAILGESRVYDGINAIPVANQFKRMALIVDAIRRAGHQGRMTLEQMAELGLEDVATRTFEIGKTRIRGVHLINEMARADFLGTFAARGFDGGPAVSGSLENVFKEADKIAAGSKPAVLRESVRGVAETSEVLGRFAAVFGQLHDGVPLEMAIRNVKTGFVDYNQLTQFERAGLKRIMSYYTFPRHYVPMVWKELGKDPRSLAVIGAAIRDSGMVDDSGGDIQLKVGNMRVGVQRTNANIDAMMAAPAIIERLVGGGKSERDLHRGLRDPGFMSTGGLASIFFGRDAFLSLDTEMPQQHWLENAMGTTFATKWAMQTVRGEMDWGDELTKYLIPARMVEEKHEQRVLLRNYKVLEAQMRDRMLKTPSPWRREMLRRELVDIGAETNRQMDNLNQ